MDSKFNLTESLLNDTFVQVAAVIEELEREKQITVVGSPTEEAIGGILLPIFSIQHTPLEKETTR